MQAPRFITQPSASGSIVAEGRTKILQCQALGKKTNREEEDPLLKLMFVYMATSRLLCTSRYLLQLNEEFRKLSIFQRGEKSIFEKSLNFSFIGETVRYPCSVPKFEPKFLSSKYVEFENSVLHQDILLG